jgi:Lar family restriction alleviation protein
MKPIETWFNEKARGEAMSAKVKLKPCPFCGGKALVYTRVFHVPQPVDRWAVGCSSSEDCTAEMGNIDTKDGAIDMWNRRAKRGRGK